MQKHPETTHVKSCGMFCCPILPHRMSSIQGATAQELRQAARRHSWRHKGRFKTSERLGFGRDEGRLMCLWLGTGTWGSKVPMEASWNHVKFQQQVKCIESMNSWEWFLGFYFSVQLESNGDWHLGDAMDSMGFAWNSTIAIRSSHK